MMMISPLRFSSSILLAGKKNKRQHRDCGARILVAVMVVSSSGSLRFLVNEGDLVASVIQTALRSYAQQRRLPVLGSDHKNFILYCGSDALNHWETIGSRGGGIRNFLLFPKPCATASKSSTTPVFGAKRRWKRWFKISSLTDDEKLGNRG